jgi:phosphoglycerol transferase MdoB-like AlkP superfamily enzyme
MSAAALDKLIWIFIFGGLLAVGLGLALQGDAGGLGRVLAWLGGAFALLGGVLIWVRSRMPAEKDE